jgi:hypothetical protein
MKRRKGRGRRGIESAHIEGLAEPLTSQTRSESEGGGESESEGESPLPTPPLSSFTPPSPS